MIDYNKMFDITGKRAVVVGGGGGIGGAIAEAFVNGGAQVAIVGRTMSKLEKKAAQIKAEYGADILCFTADCADEAAVAKLTDEVVAAMGGADILVNSQAINKKFSALTHPVDEWDTMFGANVRSVMLTCKYLGAGMKERGFGRIINISSIGAIRAKQNDSSVCYGATKGAVDSYSLNLAAGWSEFGITVNSIGPIMTETEMMKPIFEKNPELLTGTLARVPIGRVCLPSDCAAVARFLASDAAAFVTGQIIYTDGGLMTLQ